MLPIDSKLSAEQLVSLAALDCGVRLTQVDASLRERVGKFVSWINDRGPYSATQVDAMRREITRVLSVRLRLQLDRDRFQGIVAERIERPIFVVGFPRTGTTLLHSLLAEDPAVLAPKAWHLHAPSPPPGAGIVCEGRLALGQRAVERFVDMVPGILALHPYWDKGAASLIEDEEIFALDFRNAYPTQFLSVPSLDVACDAGGGDVPSTYRFHHDVLQHLQWNLGQRRWACKGVWHQFLLGPLFEMYPDAVCVWPHRSFAQIHASMVTIAAVLYNAINGGRIDWKQYARVTAEAIKAGLDHAMASPLIDDPRVVHLSFDEITSDPLAAIGKVYQRARISVSVEHERNIRAWLADPANRSDRYGRYPYSHEPFDLTPQWLDELFADYHRRFGLT